MPVSPAFVVSALQLVAILLISLVMGSVFGIWRGYDPTAYTAATFVEVHKGAVRGLNLLLPALGLGTLIAIAVLAFLAKDRPGVLWLYALTLIAVAAAGLVTRFGNQPINDQIMGWDPATLPVDWTAIRDRWWGLHQARLAASFVAELLLICAVFADRA